MRWALLIVVAACNGTAPPADAGSDADAGAPITADWVLDLDGAKTGSALAPALLGHYDLSGALFDYDKQPGLVDAMKPLGFAEWRVGAERWENGTELFPTLTDQTACQLPFPMNAFWAGTELELLAARDWFTYDGKPVTEPTTADDSRYALAYARKVLDVVAAFGAKPYFDIDAMPRALSSGTMPERTTEDDPKVCGASFCNRVSNVKPADPNVFAAAATGMIQRLVEGSNGEKGRPLPYVEVWNEPDIGNDFWDKQAGSTIQDWITMAAFTLVRLDAYRKASASPDAKAMRIGFGSFVASSTAVTILDGFDANPIPFDFISFHSYKDDPLVTVGEIAQVDAARRASKNYAKVEIALAEWGASLDASTLDPKSMDVALHDATVLALGAAVGLDHAHRSIFWDFYDIVPLGFLDHAVKPKPAYFAYALLAKVIPGDRLVLAGHEDGRFDGGMGAVLASKGGDGRIRALVVNRSSAARTVAAGTLSAMTVLDDPANPPHMLAPASVVTVPPRSIVLLER